MWSPLVRPALRRKGERLQREALLVAEAKAVKRAAKQRRDEAAAADETRLEAHTG
jgi:hypothetical protein